jgi:hypothetical protein
MGQKSNLLTLRNKEKKNLNSSNQFENSYLFLQGFKFLKYIEYLLKKKNILIVSKSINFINNKFFFNFTLYFCSFKINFYKKRVIRPLNKSKKLFLKHSNNSLLSLFLKNLNINYTNLFFLRIKVINAAIDTSLIKYFYFKLGRFLGVLFLRRFNLFLDFLKITSLFYKNKVSVNLFLYLLGQIFKVLPKSKHNRFLFFCKYLFQILIKDLNLFKNSDILGIKLVINGKLQGKTRASSSCIQVGAVPTQSLGKNIEFSKIHTYTMYGVFGFKIWICRN